MPVYHQIGHQSVNLIFEQHLSNYQGAILSPVNYTQSEVLRTIERVRENINSFEIIFDPQLYYPRTERDILRNWSYFPNDVDTADLSNFNWWQSLLRALARTVQEILPDTICTPVTHPRNFDDDYYDLMNRIALELCNSMADSGTRVLQTALVSLSDLATYQRVMSIASILTRTNADGIYLILYGDTNPRRELSDPEELKGAMLLISVLEENDINVLVGYSSSDLILWKASGASTCATGKFFNLRKFTPSRWAETEDGGGGQLPYLFEENLIANLRETDMPRVQRVNLISDITHNNPYFANIRENIDNGSPWIGLGWRFYMYWFSDIEARINAQTITPNDLIRQADRNWGIIEARDVILEERQNNGDWIRQWLRALIEFNEPW